MGARALMLQGAGSDVGKSLVTAGLCRIARRRGMKVAPFKPQNMSNNAAVCADGGEIGRAQALQARAAGLAPRVDFNPVLLKPETDRGSRLIVHGEVRGRAEAKGYWRDRGALLAPVLESFDRLAAEFDLVLVEGAGSPAEINLRRGDIANMGFARARDVPVALIGDIHRGGVIAALIGTLAVLEEADAALIEGFIINKFRGDPALFEDGVRAIEERSGRPVFGVIPWLAAAARLPAEDAVVLERPDARARSAERRLKIAAPMLSRIANFDDADPLIAEPGVDLAFIPPGRPIPRDADVILLLGTKSTRGDLAFLRAQGWDHDVIAHARGGGRVVGLCGGYQMLGGCIADPEGVDGQPGASEGLNLIDIETIMMAEKTVRSATGVCAITGAECEGYEIHSGRVAGECVTRPVIHFDNGTSDGARSEDGLVEGCHVHGLFNHDAYRRAWLTRMGAAPSDLAYEAGVEATLDDLADGIEAALNVDALFALARAPRRRAP